MQETMSSQGRMRGKVAIVTGAGSEGDDVGIGCAIAMLLAREAASVACVDLNPAWAENTARTIAAAGHVAVALSGDVTRPEDCERFVAEARDRFGGAGVLVNNVGIASAVTLDAMDLDAWDKVLRTNVTATMLMCRAVLPDMIAAGGGSIVNISSIAGIRAMGALIYGPSKAAVHQLSCEIAVLHGRQGIRANTIAPGHMATPTVMRMLPPEMREKRRKVGPLGVEGTGWDVAQAALFLASDEARFITGVHLPVDGGVTILGPLTGAAFLDD